MLFVSGASIVGNTILKGHMHRYEWSRDIESGTAATRKAPLAETSTKLGLDRKIMYLTKIWGFSKGLLSRVEEPTRFLVVGTYYWCQ